MKPGGEYLGMDIVGFEFWEGSGLQIIDVAEVFDYAGIVYKHINYFSLYQTWCLRKKTAVT